VGVEKFRRPKRCQEKTIRPDRNKKMGRGHKIRKEIICDTQHREGRLGDYRSYTKCTSKHNHCSDTQRENQYYENKIFRTYFKKFQSP
jgi:hypothetical protein